jgi:hypothetical protein
MTKYFAFYLFATLASSCGRTEISHASRSIAPHLALYGEFDRWARRISATDEEFLQRGPEAFREAVFAPLRQHENVLGAWIELGGINSPTQMVSMRADAELPKKLTWTSIRDRELGELAVSDLAPCSIAFENRRDYRDCVVISTQTRLLNRKLKLTVAFGNR